MRKVRKTYSNKQEMHQILICGDASFSSMSQNEAVMSAHGVVSQKKPMYKLFKM